MMRQDTKIGPVTSGISPELTIRRFVETVLPLTGSKCEPVCHALPRDDRVRRQPDISLATQNLDWRLTMAPDDGLKEIICYVRMSSAF